MRVLIADGDGSFRAWIRRVLESGKDWRVLDEAVDGEEALGMIARYDPEMVLLDIDLPLTGGLEVARRAKAISPRTVIVMCSLDDTDVYREAAGKSGADEFLPKLAPLANTLAVLARCKSRGSHAGELSAPLQ